MTLGDLLLRAAHRFPDRDALIFPDSRRTHEQLAGNAIEHARSLIALGIEPGEHVGILMPNCPEYIELLLRHRFWPVRRCRARQRPLQGRLSWPTWWRMRT